MPSKKKKYNARFPAGRIKKIMQTDEEVGKVAQAVPVIISRTLELFVESLLRKTVQITMAKSAKTLSPSHMKQCILSESRFDFLKDLVKSLPDSSVCDEDSSTTSGASSGVHLPASSSLSIGHQTPESVSRISQPAAPLQPPQSTLPERDSYAYPIRINPNFYTETLPTNNSGNHFTHPSTVLKTDPSSSPSIFKIDEDYDT